MDGSSKARWQDLLQGSFVLLESTSSGQRISHPEPLLPLEAMSLVIVAMLAARDLCLIYFRSFSLIPLNGPFPVRLNPFSLPRRLRGMLETGDRGCLTAEDEIMIQASDGKWYQSLQNMWTSCSQSVSASSLESSEDALELRNEAFWVGPSIGRLPSEMSAGLWFWM